MPTILLVDDDSAFAAALERLLHREGYRIHHACDCAHALELARQGEGGVDLVIADLHLCREHGLDLLDELRRLNSSLPVILVSASPDARTYLDALRLGAYEYLAKPLNFTELRQVVQRALKPGRRWYEEAAPA